MGSPRRSLLLALALWAAHGTILAIFSGSNWRLYSDIFQVAVGAITTIAAFQAGHRSRTFGKRFWGLTGTGLSILWVGIALNTWVIAFLPYATHWWSVDVLLNVWTAPLVMCLFLDPETEREEVDWPRLLDFAQVGIVAVVIYLYFSNLPVTGTPQQPWWLAMATDGLIAAGFFIRAAYARFDPVSTLFRRIGYFRLTAFFTDMYFAAGRPGPAPGRWLDLVWSGTWLIILVIAIEWDGRELPTGVSRSPLPTRRLVVTQLLPLIFPLLVLLTAARIATGQLALAAAAVLVSLGLSYARLLVTQREQQRVAEALRQSHNLLQAIIEGANDPIFVKDLDGRYLMINSAAARGVGVSIEETLGKRVEGIFNAPDAQIHIDTDRQVLESGRPVQYEWSSVMQGIPRTLVTTKGPYHDSRGKVVGLVGMSVDITERKRAEEALSRQALAMEASMDGIAIENRRQEFVYMNSAYVNIFGFERPEDLLGKTRRVLYEPDEIARFEKEILPVVAKEGRWRGEVVARRRDGTAFPEALALASLADGGMVCVCHDMSSQRKLEEQLRQAQRMDAIGTLSGGIAHDFNNLLTIIHGYSQLLLTQVQSTELGEYVRQIGEAAARAASLTRQLLAFSRRQVLQPRVFRLDTLIVNMNGMLRRMIGEDIEMLTTTEVSLGTVKADPNQIEQVVMNLIVNARDAMPHGGKLTLESANVVLDDTFAEQHLGAAPGRYVMLAVSDTGTGMDPETQAHIFEPFFTTKPLGRGTGLGLSMVYGIVKQSYGYISVYSEQGRGTTFKVYLPRVDEPAEVLGERPVAAPAGGSETILLVEDDSQVRELTRTILVTYGYSVLIAESPQEAIKLCDSTTGHIHLLLSDLVMPGLSGRELARQIAARKPEIKVLFMSGYTDHAVLHDGVLEADASFVQKPFTPAGLASKIRKVLDKPPTGRATP